MPRPLSVPLTSLKQISDLCATLERVCEGMGCPGVLIDPGQHGYALYSVRKQPRSLNSQDIIRLGDLLRGPSTIISATATTSAVANISQLGQSSLTRKERLSLALMLASTLLQLHTTSWLSERWGKQDILFLRKLDGMRNPTVEQPYISKSFKSGHTKLSHSTTQIKRRSPLLIRNTSVFDLGVLLIELCFNKSLE